MANRESTAQTVSRTVLVLAEVQRYPSKSALAEAAGMDRSKLSRLLSGHRQWTIEDLEDIAMALNLRGPGDLFRPLAELVGAIEPTASGGVTRRDTSRSSAPTSAPNGRMAQVIALRRSYQTVTIGNSNAVATVTRIGAARGGCHADTA